MLCKCEHAGTKAPGEELLRG